MATPFLVQRQWKVAQRIVFEPALVDATDQELVQHIGDKLSTILHRAVFKHQLEPVCQVRLSCSAAWQAWHGGLER